jgi:ElaB/YqjD/DUF883 family membrane-anchored ribosome-binding protein
MPPSSRDRKIEKLEVAVEDLTDRLERRLRLAGEKADEALEVARAARDRAQEAADDASEALEARTR